MLNVGVPAGSSIGMETRRNRFDANGRLLHQTVLASDNTLKNEIAYTSYDAAGNPLVYKLSDLTSADYTNTYNFTLTKGEGYQEKTISATSTVFQPGTTTNGTTSTATLEHAVAQLRPQGTICIVTG